MYEYISTLGESSYIYVYIYYKNLFLYYEDDNSDERVDRWRKIGGTEGACSCDCGEWH